MTRLPVPVTVYLFHQFLLSTCASLPSYCVSLMFLHCSHFTCIVLIAGILIIGFIDNTGLFCGSKDLIYALGMGNSTAYCIISGMCDILHSQVLVSHCIVMSGRSFRPSIKCRLHTHEGEVSQLSLMCVTDLLILLANSNSLITRPITPVGLLPSSCFHLLLVIPFSIIKDFSANSFLIR